MTKQKAGIDKGCSPPFPFHLQLLFAKEIIMQHVVYGESKPALKQKAQKSSKIR